ncbi:MAG: hypothetical protein AVDCRST_MAG30-351 [uncultured Solirubrobacteraceae bacterium]|uniref:Uncharacterized protein n=1 Tax=uncultured Solirubrobacteraceae bacterium TaxID=1162706 RepID=A0A6J4RPQ1_9ACTN|nr:MAG: hypothetical protein AVDCRST_MAG30-351 [uncultured Solirubrobacteraceae bacterium]
MAAGARAQGDRLADVERVAVRVAEDVDAGVLGQPREIRPPLGRAARGVPPGLRAAAPLRAEQREGLPHGLRVGAQAVEERAEHAPAGLGVGQRAVGGLDLDAERVGERRQAAALLERGEPAGHGDRADDGRRRPVEPRAGERLAQHPLVEARGVGDEHAAAHPCGELREDGLGRGRGVDHRLRDPGEALDAARQRLRHADERGPAVVQLPASDEHGADLGELALLARAAVGLRVDGEELGGGERVGGEVGEVGGDEHGAGGLRPPPDGLHDRLQTAIHTIGSEGVGFRSASRAATSRTTRSRARVKER